VGIDQLRDGNRLHDVGRAARRWPRPRVRRFAQVRRHAIAPRCTKPQVPNYGQAPRPGSRVGNVFAIEPMVNIGTPDTTSSRRVERRDGGRQPLGAFEHTIAVTEDGRRCSPGLNGYHGPPRVQWAGGYAFPWHGPVTVRGITRGTIAKIY